VHYPIPVHLQPAFADLHCGEGSFPVAERLAKQCLSLPMFPEMTHHQVRYVAEQIRRIFKSVRISPAQFEGTGLAIDTAAFNVTS
jgi:dTDP-4-amino-4,6-dideoxygalactose transaminase